MSALLKFTKQFVGSSFPTLIETIGGGQYVLKMRGAGNGALSLLSEYIVNKIASDLGWPVPAPQWIQIPEGFPWTFGTDEFDDIVQKSYGWNLGLRFIPEAMPINPDQITACDRSLLNQIYTIDLFFMNVDRTASACNLLSDQQGKAWIIDHGALGLFQGLRSLGFQLFKNHIFHTCFDVDTLAYDRSLHNEALYDGIIESIPMQILTEANRSKLELKALIHNRIAELEVLLT